MESNPMTNTSETGHCHSESDFHNPEVTDKRQQDVSKSALFSMKHGLENGSGSSEDITAQTDESSYYVTWKVYIALAIPRGKLGTQIV